MDIQAGKVGLHSGETGGIVPETFRIARELLNRLDDPTTGMVCKELQAEVPEFKRLEAENLAKQFGEQIYTKYELVEGVKHVNQD